MREKNLVFSNSALQQISIMMMIVMIMMMLMIIPCSTNAAASVQQQFSSTSACELSSSSPSLVLLLSKAGQFLNPRPIFSAENTNWFFFCFTLKLFWEFPELNIYDIYRFWCELKWGDDLIVLVSFF